ncbi:phenylacetate-CoA oxygenase subunit PaaJ [soil metagenome]
MSVVAIEGAGFEGTAVVAAAAVLARAWAVLDTVLDPEVPVVSLRELGIVRDVELADDGIVVVLTPTYSGCPATELIQQNVLAAMHAAGLGPVRIRMQRAPAWTTDWISAEGRQKMRDYGIVPPAHIDVSRGVPMRFVPRMSAPHLDCPRCHSTHTERISAFGSTACKSLYRCIACGEPFEYFKPI